MPKIITGRRPILSDRFPTNGMRMTATTLLQGFAVGGEIAGASAMILEHSPFGRRGYFGSFTLQGPQAGQIIAAAVFLPLSAIMSKEAFESWAGGSRHRYPQVVGRRQPDAVARTGGIGEAEHGDRCRDGIHQGHADHPEHVRAVLPNCHHDGSCGNLAVLRLLLEGGRLVHPAPDDVTGNDDQSAEQERPEGDKQDRGPQTPIAP
jgi:hypothetical protein